jgi:hypothetical protein
MTLTKKQIKDRFSKWVMNHYLTTRDNKVIVDCTDDRFHYAQNCLGDILGWPKWYAEFISELVKGKSTKQEIEYDKKVTKVINRAYKNAEKYVKSTKQSKEVNR